MRWHRRDLVPTRKRHVPADSARGHAACTDWTAGQATSLLRAVLTGDVDVALIPAGGQVEGAIARGLFNASAVKCAL